MARAASPIGVGIRVGSLGPCRKTPRAGGRPIPFCKSPRPAPIRWGSRMNRNEAFAALELIADAVVEAVEKAGDFGAPAGYCS